MHSTEPPAGASEVASPGPPEQDPGQDATGGFRSRLPGRATLVRDAVAGLNSAISNVPDGMANAVVVGVSPAYGLYATMLGPGVGGLFASTQLMMITTTAAASLATGEALAGRTGEARAEALFLLVVLIGALQVVCGWLRLGRLIRFVSFSVMTGFLTGVSVLLVLSQLSTVTGVAAAGSNRLLQALDLLTHLGRVSLPSLGAALLTLGLALFLPRTRLGNLGRLVAVVVPSVLVALTGTDRVQTVADVGEIPRGLPMPALPSLNLITLDLLTGALAVATIILVQGAGVSQSVANPDGSRSDLSRDFVAEGAANVATGLFQGLPVGGSLSATALNQLYGGGSRWSVVLAGGWMALVVLAVPGLVAYTAMPALGALLILAGASSIRPAALRSIWRVGWPSRVASLTTFLAMLFLPIQAAVGIGVALSALLYLYESSTEVSVVELLIRSDGQVEEQSPPRELPSERVTVLDIYGHLFYAGAHTLERRLPRPEGSRHPAVILRLRGRGSFGATLLEVLATYAKRLESVGGRLYLTGLDERGYVQVARSGKLHPGDTVRAYRASSLRGDATRTALAEAQDWLASVSSAPADLSPDSEAPSEATPEAPSGDVGGPQEAPEEGPPR